MFRNKIALVMTICLLFGLSSAYVTSIRAPAVIVNQTQGTLTTIILNITPGNGHVSVIGPSSVAQDTLSSAYTAAAYASQYSNVQESSYNFTYTVQSNNTQISGPSAGLAFTVLAIAGFQHKQLPQNVTATGTIQTNGSVGLIGGVYDKADAAKRGGISYLLVPYAVNGSFEYNTYYIAQQVFNIPIVEVKNVQQALNYIFGGTAPKPLIYNINKDYKVNSLPVANLTCNSCNLSTFSALTNFTLNFTSNHASGLNPSYAAVKASLLLQINQYRTIASKGYHYTPADLAFHDYINAFVFENSNNLTIQKTLFIINNVSSYCSSLVVPQMTTLNYEYVIGGELRQSWANITIQTAVSTLNLSDGTDGALDSLYAIAPAYAWCKAANKMYSIASGMGGTPVVPSSQFKQKVFGAISNSSRYGGTIYQQSATNNYKAGNYAAALYATVYASIYNTQTPKIVYNSTTARLLGKNLTNASSSSLGVWPHEFGNQVLFYLYEANGAPTDITSSSYMNNAYTSLLLAIGLSNANKAITSSFVNVTSLQPSPVIVNQINSLQAQLNMIYAMLAGILVLLLLIITIFLIHVLKKKVRRTRKRR